jgi:hypothetical protein
MSKKCAKNVLRYVTYVRDKKIVLHFYFWFLRPTKQGTLISSLLYSLYLPSYEVRSICPPVFDQEVRIEYVHCTYSR